MSDFPKPPLGKFLGEMLISAAIVLVACIVLTMLFFVGLAALLGALR